MIVAANLEKLQSEHDIHDLNEFVTEAVDVLEHAVGERAGRYSNKLGASLTMGPKGRLFYQDVKKFKDKIKDTVCELAKVTPMIEQWTKEMQQIIGLAASDITLLQSACLKLESISNLVEQGKDTGESYSIYIGKELKGSFRDGASRLRAYWKQEWAEHLNEAVRESSNEALQQWAEQGTRVFQHLDLVTKSVEKAQPLFEDLETLEALDYVTYSQDIADALVCQRVSIALQLANEINRSSPESSSLTIDVLKNIAPVLLSRSDSVLPGDWGVEMKTKLRQMDVLKAESQFCKTTQAVMEQHVQPVLDPLLNMFQAWGQWDPACTTSLVQQWDPACTEDLERAFSLGKAATLAKEIGDAATLAKEIGDDTFHVHVSLLSFLTKALLSTAEAYKLYVTIKDADGVNNLKLYRMKTDHTQA